jgi:phosphomevalonate kinase
MLQKFTEILNENLSISKKILEEINKMAPTLVQIKAAITLVAEVTTAIQDIQTLNTQLAAAIDAEADPTELQAIIDEIATATAALTAALPAPVTPPAGS